MSSIQSYAFMLLYFRPNVTPFLDKRRLFQNSICPFLNLFFVTSHTNNKYMIAKLCTNKNNSSNTGDKSPIDNKNGNSNLQNPSRTNGGSQGQVSDDTFFTKDSAFGSKENKGFAGGSRPFFNPEDSEENLITDYELQPPTNCCMSGCPNCVWLEYVENLTKIYTNPALTREKILKELDTMEDQNIKAFIMMELRTRKLI